MNWKQLISAKRFGMEEFHEERQENRSEFQRDYDRLIFSAPFRRLQNKTQVFPLPGSVFVHNRLTHSLEVASVGRSLGDDVAKALLERHPELQDSFLPEIGSIVSAACLAHDLGNPPFGHSGEKAISTFFSEGKGVCGSGKIDWRQPVEDYVSSYSAKLPAVSDRFIYPEYSLCNSVRGIFKLSGRGSSAAQRQLGPDGSAGEKVSFF